MDGGRPVRVYRLGKGYDWPDIQRGLMANLAQYGPRFYSFCNDPRYGFRAPQTPPARRVRRYRSRNLLAAKRKGSLYGLYLHYCYRLGIYPRRAAPQINWPELRAQWRDIKQVCREMRFVSEHRFADLSAVCAYREAVSVRITALQNERTGCVRQLRRKAPPPGLEQQRAELTARIRALRAECSLAERVIQRVQNAGEHRRAMQQLNEQQVQAQIRQKRKKHEQAR